MTATQTADSAPKHQQPLNPSRYVRPVGCMGVGVLRCSVVWRHRPGESSLSPCLSSVLTAMHKPHGRPCVRHGGVEAQFHGRGSRLLHIQAAQRPLRTGRRDSGGGCQQWNISARDSSGIGSAKWSSVQAHDTFSDDPGCGRSSANAVPPADDTIVLAARLALHADVGLFLDTGSQRSTTSFITCGCKLGQLYSSVRPIPHSSP